MHTLVLVGELDRRSAATLEAEIEWAYDAGADAITLDLSGLTYIDVSGVAVVEFRRGWCERRGCRFALIPAAPPVQRAFERAGTIEALPFVEADDALLLTAAAEHVEGEPAHSVIAPSRSAELAEAEPAQGVIAPSRELSRVGRSVRVDAPARSMSVLHLSGQRRATRKARRRRRGRR